MGERKQLRSVALGTLLASTAALTAYATRRPAVDPLTGEIPAVEETTSSSVSWDLPMRRTDRVAYFEDLLTGRRRTKMKLWLEQSGRYVPMIRQELRKRGMPEDLVYLAFIESGFSPDAYSRTAAVGLWQLMEGTGKELGLKVTPYVDQRRDPVAATDAALDFLEDLHRQFGSWWLAAAAYNCGPGRVSRVLREVTGKTTGDDDTYWQIASHLPKETQDYVPLMLAAGEIAKDPQRYGFTDLDYHRPLRFDTVQVPGGTKLSTISQATGADSSVVDQLNPHYVKNVTPPSKSSVWAVRIPEGLKDAFAANFPHLFALQQELDAQKVSQEHARTPERRHALTKSKSKTHHASVKKSSVKKSSSRERSHHHAAKRSASKRRHHR